MGSPARRGASRTTKKEENPAPKKTTERAKNKGEWSRGGCSRLKTKKGDIRGGEFKKNKTKEKENNKDVE